MARARQQQIVSIDRGLFLIRYAGAEDTAHPPTVRVYAEPTPNKEIGFLLHPDHRAAELWQPDSCLVARALVPGKLTVEVMASCDGGSSAATVRIEPLTQGRPIPSEPTAPLAQAQSNFAGLRSDRTGLRILGHVPGIGDQVVNASEWLAGPSAPSRIEGVAIDWPDKPDDLEIRYAVKTAKPELISGRSLGLGSFAGTRGKAMPIVGVMLEMSGVAATNLQFVVEAVFLGAPVMRIIGKRIIASGPTGREPLVGLRLSVENAAAVEQPKPPLSPREPAGRVRVFRGRQKSNEQIGAAAEQPKPTSSPAGRRVRVFGSLQKPEEQSGAAAEQPKPTAPAPTGCVRALRSRQKSKEQNGAAAELPKPAASPPAERAFRSRQKSKEKNGPAAKQRKPASSPLARRVRAFRSRVKSKEHLTA